MKAILNYVLQYCQKYIQVLNVDSSVIDDSNKTNDDIYIVPNKIIVNDKAKKIDYCHINCILNAMMIYCLTQCKYVFRQLLNGVGINTIHSNHKEKYVNQDCLRILIKEGRTQISIYFSLIIM